MKHQVLYSEQAIRDLDKIWVEVFEATKDPEKASGYIDELVDKVDERGRQPESGAPLMFGDLFTGYRIILFKAYIAFYRANEKSIFVDRILHQRSDYIFN